MSRLTTMSAEAIRAVFSPDSDTDLFVLLTIYDPSNPNTVLARISDGYTKRIAETADTVTYGVTSRSADFTFLPVEISLPSEEEAQAPRCTVSIKDVTNYLIPIIRTIFGQPKVLMELVLAKTPDTVEASFSGFYITNVTYNSDTVAFELAMIDYEKEPFPSHSFTPFYFPGLF